MQALPPIVLTLGQNANLDPTIVGKPPVRGYTLYNTSPLVLAVTSGGDSYFLPAGGLGFIDASEALGEVTINPLATTVSSVTSGTLYVTAVFINDKNVSIPKLSSLNSTEISGGALDTTIIGVQSGVLFDVSGSTVNTNVTNVSKTLGIDIADSDAPADSFQSSGSTTFAVGFTPVMPGGVVLANAIIIRSASFAQSGSTSAIVGMGTGANVNSLFVVGSATALIPTIGKGIQVAAGSSLYFYCSTSVTGIFTYTFTTL